MRIKWTLLGAVAVTLTAQTPPSAPRGFGPPMASAQLAQQPQTKGAKGDQERHYYFEAAKQEMPYHLIVPQKYDGKTEMPLVVALHGYGGNQDYFSVLVKSLPELCEQYGFIFRRPDGLLDRRVVWRSLVYSRQSTAQRREAAAAFDADSRRGYP